MYGPKSMRAAVGAVMLGCGIALAATPALASENKGSTEVTVVASNDNLAFRVPTIIPFSAAADGVLTGPTPSATLIENLSVFSIHVVNMEVATDKPWTLMDSAQGSMVDNSIDYQVGPAGDLKDAFAASAEGGMDLSHDAAYNMGYDGSDTCKLPLETTGDIARSTGDIYHEASKVGTITWTLEAGLATKADV